MTVKQITCSKCGIETPQGETICPFCDGKKTLRPNSNSQINGNASATLSAQNTSTVTSKTSQKMKYSNPFTAKSNRIKLGCVQLGVAVDKTASSSSFEQGVKYAAQQIFNSIENLVSSLSIWVQGHGDLTEGEQPVLVSDGLDAQQAADDIQNIDFEGGGSTLSESHIDGIENLINIVPWSTDNNSRSAVIAFLNGESKISNTTAEELGREIKKRRIFLYLICECTPQLYKLAKAADAKLFPISNSPSKEDLNKIIQPLCANVTAPYHAVKTTPYQGT